MNEPPIHINTALKNIINKFVEEKQFERRFPRDDLSRDQKCRFQPGLKQKQDLFKIVQKISEYDKSIDIIFLNSK